MVCEMSCHVHHRRCAAGVVVGTGVHHRAHLSHMVVVGHKHYHAVGALGAGHVSHHVLGAVYHKFAVVLYLGCFRLFGQHF